MTSNRVGHRRGGAPTTLSLHPKSALSVEEWEARAPLGDLEIKSVNALKLAGEKVPLPLKVCFYLPISIRFIHIQCFIL